MSSRTEDHEEKRNGERNMRFHEVKKNVFTVPKDYALAHCISYDCVMGAGIASSFKRCYPGIKEYCLSRPRYVGKAILFKPNNDKHLVFNLVTKIRYYHKPTLFSLKQALLDMKNRCIKEGITKIAMPRIGSGLDKLKWHEVRQAILSVFDDTDIDIMVCYI